MNVLFRKPIAIGMSIAIIATAGFAATSTNKAVAARHAQMQMVAYNLGLLGSMAKGEMEFSAEMANSAATNLNTLSKLDPVSLWLPGTEQGAADGSRAKAEIWSDFAGFGEKLGALQTASANMIGVADLDALKAGMGPIGASCKGCHETYRGPEN